jgi:hypothetical protein
MWELAKRILWIRKLEMNMLRRQVIKSRRALEFILKFNFGIWISIDTESINTFIYGIRNCRILKWEKNYNNPHILDGTQWSLNIELDDRIIEKSGSNAYPNEWEEFCNTIQKLTGKPFD